MNTIPSTAMIGNGESLEVALMALLGGKEGLIYEFVNAPRRSGKTVWLVDYANASEFPTLLIAANEAFARILRGSIYNPLVCVVSQNCIERTRGRSFSLILVDEWQYITNPSFIEYIIKRGFQRAQVIGLGTF